MDLARRRKQPLPDVVCFHCQQAAEKYLKACLEEDAVKFPKTHDVESLLALLIPLRPMLSPLTSAAKRLTPFGVLIRYPGNDATPSQARQALVDWKLIRKEARFSLGLPT